MEIPQNWEEENKELQRVFPFANFVKAVEFVQRIVPLAEETQHHPDVEIFSYNKVKIKLTTHEENKITEKDIQMAKKIGELYSSLK